MFQPWVDTFLTHLTWHVPTSTSHVLSLTWLVPTWLDLAWTLIDMLIAWLDIFPVQIDLTCSKLYLMFFFHLDFICFQLDFDTYSFWFDMFPAWLDKYRDWLIMYQAWLHMFPAWLYMFPPFLNVSSFTLHIPKLTWNLKHHQVSPFLTPIFYKLQMKITQWLALPILKSCKNQPAIHHHPPCHLNFPTAESCCNLPNSLTIKLKPPSKHYFHFHSNIDYWHSPY